MRLSSLLVASAVITAAPASAGAICGEPSSFVAPPGGSSLPPDPEIYLFHAWGDSWDRRPLPLIAVVDPVGAPVRFSIDVATKSAAYDALRISIHRQQPGPITVRLGDQEAAFTIDPGWSGPAATTVAIESRRYAWHRSTCSREDSLRLVPSVDAPVYRIDLDVVDDDGELRRRSIVHPRDRAGFWAREAPSSPELALGTFNCMGDNVDLERASTVRVSALLADGSSIPGVDLVDVQALVDELRPAALLRDRPGFKHGVADTLIGRGKATGVLPRPAWPYYALGVVVGLAGMALRARRRARSDRAV